MHQLVMVALGGACGAIARYAVNVAVQKKYPDFPWATLIVNVAGCFLIGFLFAVALEKRWYAEWGQPLLVTGFLGSLTTFSAFGMQTVELLNTQQYKAALANVALNLCVGLAAVWIGMRAAKVV